MPKKNNKKESPKLRDWFGLGDQQRQGKRRPSPPSRKTHFTIWYFIIAFLLIFLVQSYLTTQKVNEISYSQFKGLVKENRVENLVITPEVIKGKIKGAEGLDSAEKPSAGKE